jgi:hypothetical protein
LHVGAKFPGGNRLAELRGEFVQKHFVEMGMAISGFAARLQEGRLPFFVLAKSVNWLDDICPPPTRRLESLLNPVATRRHEV